MALVPAGGGKLLGHTAAAALAAAAIFPPFRGRRKSSSKGLHVWIDRDRGAVLFQGLYLLETALPGAPSPRIESHVNSVVTRSF